MLRKIIIIKSVIKERFTFVNQWNDNTDENGMNARSGEVVDYHVSTKESKRGTVELFCTNWNQSASLGHIANCNWRCVLWSCWRLRNIKTLSQKSFSPLAIKLNPLSQSRVVELVELPFVSHNPIAVWVAPHIDWTLDTILFTLKTFENWPKKLAIHFL